ncbi:TPA: PadR family transcriptional regulator [Clostridium botulinum]|nr:PadR family transcriptional regulator [Clostridium botulinum]
MNRNKNLPLTETTYYIFLTLLEPDYGYIIMEKVEELSNYQVKIVAGTLYGAIENLLKQKLIKFVGTEDNRRKVYVITEKEKEILLLDIERMHHMINIAESKFGGN